MEFAHCYTEFCILFALNQCDRSQRAKFMVFISLSLGLLRGVNQKRVVRSGDGCFHELCRTYPVSKFVTIVQAKVQFRPRFKDIDDVERPNRTGLLVRVRETGPDFHRTGFLNLELTEARATQNATFCKVFKNTRLIIVERVF